MENDDTLIEQPENTAVMEKTEWDRAAQSIRDKMAEIEKDFGEAPPKYIRTRKGAGGRDWSYVRPDFCEIALHKHLPDWSVVYGDPQVIGPKEGYPKPVVYVSGKLTFTIAGVRRVVGGVGEKDVEFTYRKAPKKQEVDPDEYWLVPVSGQAKAAESDCFKRCCIRALRLARNVYRQKDDEYYSQFALKPSDIDALRTHEEMLEKIQERAESNDLTKAKLFLEEIRRILNDPDEVVRYEVLDLAKEVTKFESTFHENWSKQNETR